MVHSLLHEDLRFPDIGNVTSEPPRTAISPTNVIQTLVFVSVAAFLASMLLGLSFSQWNIGGWHSLMTAILTVGFQLFPIALRRQPT
jgi:hypothetical protein